MCRIDVLDSCDTNLPESSDGTVRGRLEMYHGAVTATITSITDGPIEVDLEAGYGGICDDYYTDRDAIVACGELGSQSSDYTIVHPEFGRTLRRLTGPSLIDPNGSNTRENNKFWLDDLLCESTHSRLIDCPRRDNAIGQHNCRKDEHAGAVCYKSVVAPKKPENLSATSKEQTMIGLEWDAPDSIVTGYKIEVSEDGGVNWTDRVFNTGSTRTRYNHQGLSLGDTRHYRVSAINSEGTSDPSNIASATVGGTSSVDEPGMVTLSSFQPQVGTAVTATLSDPDGSVSGETWIWEKSTDKSSWSEISGETSASYTPGAGDVGYYLRATASYSDGQGSGKSAEAVSQNQVQAAPVSNSAPEFSGTTTTRSVDENTGAGVNIEAPVSATDQNNDTLEYSLGGADAASFDIVASSGQLQTKTALDYESSKRSYSVIVTAKDPFNASDTITVTISVVNVDEPGTVTLSSPEPRVTMEVTATLSDLDGSVSGVTWQWYRSTNQNNPNSWTPISGETSDSYTPGVDDELRYLRATASYTDPEDSGKTAHGVSDNVAPVTNNPPEFSSNTQDTFSVAENTPAGEDIGEVTATDSDTGDVLTYSLGGTDGTSFRLVDQTSGQIETYAALNYETKNSYSVVVTAKDPSRASDTITVTINVTDVEEPGKVTLSPVLPQVDTPLTATVSDPDGSVSGATWTWERSHNGSDWENISGVTSASYTPVTADINHLLRATALYTDRRGSGKTARGISDNAVRAAPVTNNPPEFSSNTQDTFSVAENTPAGEDIGEVTATDSDTGDVLTYSLGGTDGTSFRLVDQTSGQIETYAALNYETKNSYSVVVTAKDPSRASDTITVTINVTDVDEPAIVTLSPPQPRVGSAVTTRLTEPDGQINNVGWEWHRSLDKSSDSWSSISGVTLGIYTPVADDIGYYLRATAFYDDTHGSQSPQAVSDNPVRAASSTRTNNPVTKFTPAVPHAPSGLTAVRGDAEVTLNWRAPNDGGSAINDYEYKVDNGKWISTQGKSTTYTVIGLTNGETYRFRVRAVNSVGPGAESKPARATPATVPGAPRNLTLTSGSQYMMLIWERPADNGGLPITGYEYIQKEEDGSFGEWTSIDKSAPGETNETTYAVTDLKNGTIYSFRVRAVNAIGPGDPSAEATAEVNTPSFRRARRASLNILPTFGRTMLRNSVDALTWRLDSVLSGSFERTGMFRLMDQHAGLHEVLGDNIWDDPDQWEDLSLEELLYGSSFIIEAGVMLKKPKEHPKEAPKEYKGYTEEDSREHIREYPEEDSADKNMWIDEDEKPMVAERRGGIGFWGKADYNNLSVSSDEWFAWDGRIVSGYMGVDRWLNEKVLTGLSVSLTKGDFDYTDTTPGEGGRGDYYVKMLSVSPYVSWFLSDDAYLWGSVGYGRGQVDIDDEDVQSVATSDLSYKSVAAGGSGRLFDVGDTTFSLKSEAFKVWMDVEGDDYLIDELSIGVHQLRLSMEGSYEYRFASGTWFNPLVEVALRHDGGDGETGTGVELGGGFLYEDPNLGLSVSGRGRWLAAHSSDEFSQWGVGGAVIFDTGADKQGALFSVSPEWGDTSSGVDSLWERGVEGLSSEDGGANDMHLDAEFGYGLSALGGDGLFTPYSGLRVGGDGWRQYRLGSRLDLGRSASLSLETDRRQSDTTKPEHGIMLRGKLNF